MVQTIVDIIWKKAKHLYILLVGASTTVHQNKDAPSEWKRVKVSRGSLGSKSKSIRRISEPIGAKINRKRKGNRKRVEFWKLKQS